MIPFYGYQIIINQIGKFGVVHIATFNWHNCSFSFCRKSQITWRI